MARCQADDQAMVMRVATSPGQGLGLRTGLHPTSEPGTLLIPPLKYFRDSTETRGNRERRRDRGGGQSLGWSPNLFPPAEGHDSPQHTHSWPLRLAWGTRPATDQLLVPVRGGHFPDPGQPTATHNSARFPRLTRCHMPSQGA